MPVSAIERYFIIARLMPSSYSCRHILDESCIFSPLLFLRFFFSKLRSTRSTLNRVSSWFQRGNLSLRRTRLNEEREWTDSHGTSSNVVAIKVDSFRRVIAFRLSSTLFRENYITTLTRPGDIPLEVKVYRLALFMRLLRPVIINITKRTVTRMDVRPI